VDGIDSAKHLNTKRKKTQMATTTLYGTGNKPHFVSYSGGSTYTTQTYCEPPQWKLAYTMTTEFGDSIGSKTVPIAEYSCGVFSGEAHGLWIYRLFKGGDLVGTYQFQDQVFCVPADFDRVEGVCMSVWVTPSGLAVDAGTPTPVPTPAPMVLLVCAAIFCGRRKLR
jgi:hypothetical protein